MSPATQVWPGQRIGVPRREVGSCVPRSWTGVQVPLGETVVSLAADQHHSVVVVHGGKVLAWAAQRWGRGCPESWRMDMPRTLRTWTFAPERTWRKLTASKQRAFTLKKRAAINCFVQLTPHMTGTFSRLFPFVYMYLNIHIHIYAWTIFIGMCDISVNVCIYMYIFGFCGVFF